MFKKLAIGAAISLAVVTVGGCVVLSVCSDPRPTGTPGAEADALAREVQETTGVAGWNATGAVRFRLHEGRPEILWDRARGLVRVDDGDRRVYLRTADQTGVVIADGDRVADPAALERAWASFINDSFWLYPFRTFFDDGVTRSLVPVDEGRGLLIEYSSGGVTPGDAYLWFVDDDGAPTAWRMWVSVLPIGGLEVGWGGWQRLPTGARVPLERSGFGFDWRLQAEGAATLAELVPGDDPFAPLLAPAKAPAAEPGPASRPAN